MMRRMIAMYVMWGGLLMAQDGAVFRVSIADQSKALAQCVERGSGLVCSSRKPISIKEVAAVKKIDGVEDVILIRRYSFMVVTGELFNNRDIGSAILKVLK